MVGRVAGKVAIVTGGARGQGRAHAQLLAHEGARILVMDVLVEEGSESVALIQEAGGEACFLEADVGSEAAWKQAVAFTLARWGRIDVLVNNAGIIRTQDFLSETLEGWNDVIRVNQTGVFLGIKHVVPVMIEQQGGSIINIASNQGIAALPGYAAYHPSKAAIILMTKNAAVDYGRYGIRVNAVCPGLVWTAMSENDPTVDKMIEQTPLRRGAQPEEISPGVLFLASDESRFVTGTELIMDGGYLAQ